jgi:hypothetical protein
MSDKNIFKLVLIIVAMMAMIAFVVGTNEEVYEMTMQERQEAACEYALQEGITLEQCLIDGMLKR